MKCIKVLNMAAIIIAAILNSCGNQSHYFGDSLKVYDYKEVDHSKELSGTPIIKEAIGAYSINVVDTIICLANHKTDLLFSLYNINGDSIVSIGRYGKGPSDFINNRMNRQNTIVNDNAGMWVVDVNAAALKHLTLTKSIRARESCVDSIIAIRPMVKNAYIAGDTILQEIINEGNFNISLSTVKGESFFEEPLYKYTVNPSELFTFYDGSMGVSPDGSYLVSALSSINQVNILDLRTGRRRAVSVGGVKEPDDVLNRESMVPLRTYYSNLSLGDKYIYALYEDQPYINQDGENKKSVLHIIDYDGNIVSIIPLDRFLYSISYSEKNNSIYGLDDNETVWKYNLSEINL